LKQSGILAKLKSSNFTPQQIDEYILFSATQELLQKPGTSFKDQESQDFLFSFKKLNNELNIPDSTPKTLASDPSKLTAELFHTELGNNHLKKQAEQNQELHKTEYPTLFKHIDLSKLSQWMGEEFPEQQKLYEEIR
jgi:hypothetical protein